MGQLAQIGGAVGQWATGGLSAANAANTSLGLGTLATGSDVFGAILKGVGSSQQAGYAASIAGQDANAALQAGQTAEEESKLRFGALTSEEKASAAARGVSVNTGSAASVQQSTQQIGAIDAALLHYNAMREAYGAEARQSLDKAAQRNAILQGLYGASASFISGAAGLSGKYAQYQQTGVFMKPQGLTIPTPASSPVLDEEPVG